MKTGILNNYFMLKEYNVMVNYVFFVFCTIILTFQPMKYAVQLQKIHTFMNDFRQFHICFYHKKPTTHMKVAKLHLALYYCNTTFYHSCSL